VNARAFPVDDSMMKRLYFHHIPKTAGTSLREFMIDRAGAANVAPMLRGGQLRDALRDYSRFTVITGHLTPFPGDTLPSDRATVTLLRNPIDRVLSSFYFERNVYTAARRSSDASPRSLGDWIASLTESGASDLNAHLLALWPLCCNKSEPPSGPARIEAAKRALDTFDVVGLQSSLADTLALVAIVMGWLPPRTIPHANRTPGRLSLDDVPASVARKLEQLLAPDLEIYAYGLTLFETQRHRALCGAAAWQASRGNVVDAAGPGHANAGERDTESERPTEAPMSTWGHVAAGRARSTGAARIERGTVRGDVSEGRYLQSGERAVLTFDVVAMVEVDDLDVGFGIRDATGALVFAINTRVLGEVFTLAPGRYAVAFTFQNELGVGHYRVSAALHRGVDRAEGLVDHAERICEFDVVDHLGTYFEGRVRLHVDVEVCAVAGDGRVRVQSPKGGANKFAFLARRNPELSQFSADLQPLAEVRGMPAAADAVMNLAIRNTSGVPWPAFGRRAVFVSYHWMDRQGSIIVFDGLRTTLPRDVVPGEVVELACFLRAPEIPGSMRLAWTLVQEDVAWFDDRNPASACVLDVEIR
jgi:hypothetical protein